MRLQLCSLKCGLSACSRAATLISRETDELPEGSLVMFCGTFIVAKSEVELELKLERPFFASTVTPKWSAASPLFCSLYELNRAERRVGRRLNLVLYSHSIFAAIVYGSKESMALEMRSRKYFHEARKAATALEDRTCTKMKESSRFRVVLASRG